MVDDTRPSSVSGRWAGHVYGTNTGNISLQLDGPADALKGILRVNEHLQGIAVFDVSGSFAGSSLVIAGVPTEAVEKPEEVGTVHIEATLTPEGHLNGDWWTSQGAGGPLLLFPHGRTSSSAPKPEGAPPEQLRAERRVVGAVRLFAEDVRELIHLLGKDFRDPRVVISYNERGAEVSRYAADVLPNLERMGVLTMLRLTVQEPELYGVNRTAVVELQASGQNEVRVQGVHDTWVLGKAEALAAQLKRHEKVLATTFRKFGLNLNALILMATLVALPELRWDRRVVFMAVVAALLWAITSLHTRLIPNAAIYLTSAKPTVLQRAWPQALSWGIAFTSAVVASVVYGILRGELDLGALGNWAAW